jgi:hypothetical protein
MAYSKTKMKSIMIKHLLSNRSQKEIHKEMLAYMSFITSLGFV